MKEKKNQQTKIPMEETKSEEGSPRPALSSSSSNYMLPEINIYQDTRMDAQQRFVKNV